MRTSFLLHIDSLSILDKMSNEQAGILLKAMYFYQINGKLPELDFAIEMAVTPFVNQFKRDSDKYSQVVEKRKKAGAKGGKQKVANASKSKQNLANLADNDNVNDSDSDNKKEIINYDRVFLFFKETTQKNVRVFTNKAKGQLRERLKDGFTYEDIESAIKNCKNNEWHSKPENSHHLTLEFILRQDKLEMYRDKAKPKQLWVEVLLNHTYKDMIKSEYLKAVKEGYINCDNPKIIKEYYK